MESTSSQRILGRNRIVVAPVDYQDILKMEPEGTSGLPVEPYLWLQHSNANPSPTQRHCRALSRWLALPVLLLMAMLLPKRRQLLASPMAADIIMNLFQVVLEQMCLVSATNVLLSNSSAPAGCSWASRMQAGLPRAGRKKQLHIVFTQTYDYVRGCALSIRTKTQL